MIARILLLVILVNTAAASAFDQSLIQKASFEETFDRYPSPYAILQQFKRIMPVDGNPNAHLECTSMSEMSAPVSGVNDPMQLGPLEQTPGELFFQYYIDCVQKIVSGGFSNSVYSKQNVEAILTVEDRAFLVQMMNKQCLEWKVACSDSDAVFLHNAFTATNWNSITPQLQLRLINAFLLYLVGPEIILRSKGYLGENNVFDTFIPDQPALAAFLNKFALSYNVSNFGGTEPKIADIYAQVAIIVRLGPALKN